MEVQVNYLAVLGAAVASMIVGAVWYAKPVFGTKWQKLVGLKDDDMKKSAARAMTFAFVCSLIMAYVLAHVSYLSNQFFQHSYLQDSLMTAFWLWLGIAATRVVTHDAFEQRDMQLTALTVFNQLATMLAMGLVIGLMGVN